MYFFSGPTLSILLFSILKVAVTVLLVSYDIKPTVGTRAKNGTDGLSLNVGNGKQNHH